MPAPNPYGLPPLQYRFVQEYLIDFNGTAAYRRAGYKATPEAARRNASRLLTNADIQEALTQEIARLFDAYDVTAEKVVREYARLGFSDMRDYAAWDRNGVRLKSSDDLSEDAARAVAEVSEETRTYGDATVRTVRFKLHSKTDGLQSLAKYLDLFGETKALNALGQGLASLLAQATTADDTE